MKTTKSQLADGSTIEATSATDFVTKLREGSRFHNTETDEQFMQGFALRYKELHGVTVDTSSANAFVSSLLELGYIESVEVV